jgi:hypothetical protein
MTLHVPPRFREANTKGYSTADLKELNRRFDDAVAGAVQAFERRASIGYLIYKESDSWTVKFDPMSEWPNGHMASGFISRGEARAYARQIVEHTPRDELDFKSWLERVAERILAEFDAEQSRRPNE